MSLSATELARIGRFGAAGVLNTVVGYLVILVCLFFGAGDIAANVSGYAVGIVLGFFVNGRWTFGCAALLEPRRIARYVAVFLVAYCINLFIVLVLRQTDLVERPLAHLVGIGVYSTIFYFASARFVFAETDAAEYAPRRWFRVGGGSLAIRWPELSLLIGWVAAFAAMHGIQVSHDIYWQMWIARQMLGGAKLYSDILEINPPLWFWMALPVERLAEAASFPPVATMVAAIFLYIGVALAALSILVRERAAGVRAAILLAALVAMTFLSMHFFGQREHLVLIAVLPYVALIARRREGLPTGTGIVLVVGLVAAMGFALKHYFVLVPLALELWLIWRLRRSWRPVRPELLVLCAVAVLYALAVFLLTPDFFKVIVPMVRLAYGGYEVPFLAQVSRPFLWGWLFAAIVWWKYRNKLPPLAEAAFIAASVFCLCYFLQAKGWGYHAVPAIACAFFAVAVLATDQVRRAVDLARHPAMVAALATPLVFAALWGAYANRNRDQIDELLKGVEPNAPVIMLTANPSNIWPMVIKEGYNWPSRYFSFWMLHAIAGELKNQGHLSGRIVALADKVRSDTVKDLACNPPELIIVDDFSNIPGMRAIGFDALDFFEKDVDFRQFFAHYDRRTKLGRFTSFEKSSAWTPARPSGCIDLR